MGVCVERGCPRPNSHIPQIHPRQKKKKRSYYKKQKYLTPWKYNSYLSTWRLHSESQNQTMKLLVLGIEWSSYGPVLTMNYLSIHRSIRSTKLPNTHDSTIFNRFAGSKKSYDKNGLSQPILALILTLFFWVWINLQIPMFRNIYVSPTHHSQWKFVWQILGIFCNSYIYDISRVRRLVLKKKDQLPVDELPATMWIILDMDGTSCVVLDTHDKRQIQESKMKFLPLHQA
jgi:hypothetical protein